MPPKVLLSLRAAAAIFTLATVASTLSDEPQYVKIRGYVCPNPSASNGLRLGQAVSVRHCAYMCSQTDRCDRFSLSSPPADSNSQLRQCYMSDSALTVDQQWIKGDCETYSVYPIPLPDFAQMQMKLMYNFKTAGLENMADPGSYSLSATNVSLTNDGAEFQGNMGSYLKTETPGFEQFLDYATRHSFFVQARHIFANEMPQAYYRVEDCNHDKHFSASHYVKIGNNGFLAQLKFASGSPYKLVTTTLNNVVPNDGSEQLVSTGFTFNGTQLAEFFVNGSTFTASASDGAQPGKYIPTKRFQCLLLGFSNFEEDCLKGQMQCFGLSTKVLSESEFRQLEAHCLI